jgi:hypothetical protein
MEDRIPRYRVVLQWLYRYKSILMLAEPAEALMAGITLSARAGNGDGAAVSAETGRAADSATRTRCLVTGFFIWRSTMRMFDGFDGSLRSSFVSLSGMSD